LQLELSQITQSLRETIDSSVERGLAPLSANEPIKADVWADRNFWLSAESSGTTGPWTTRSYQKAILNAMSNDDVRVLTFKKSARVGYTKLLLIDIAYKIVIKRRNQLIYQPTDTDAKDFVKDEVDTMIRDVPVVAELLKADPDKRSGKNTLGKKQFVGTVLDIKGGKSPGNYRRMTKDDVKYDELDAFDPDIGKGEDKGEGSATRLGDARTRQSSFPKSIRGSTPSILGASQIDKSLAEADAVFERYIPCPHCDEFHTLKWRNIKWTEGDHKTTYCVCEDCGSPYDYSDYEGMDIKGQWRTTDGMWIDDDEMFRSPDDEYVDPPFHAGFFIWSAYSYDYSWQEMVREFIHADKQYKENGDPSALKTFWNTNLGESYDMTGKDSGLDWVKLKARAEPFKMYTVPMKGLLLSMGVDTQDDRLEYILDAWGKGQERWTIGAGELYGDPAMDGVWKELTLLLEREYEHASGAMLRISSTAIDTAGHRTQAVYNYCRGRPNVIAIIGRGGIGRPVIGRPTLQDVSVIGKTVKGGIKLWSVGVETTKAMVYARFCFEDKGPGYHHFPIGLDDEFYMQIVSEKLVTKYKNGIPSQVWTKTRARNEKFDCANYSYAAAIKFGMERIDWDSLEADILDLKKDEKSENWYYGN